MSLTEQHILLGGSAAPPPRLKGYLKKRGEKGVKKMSKRWFEQDGDYLGYYPSEEKSRRAQRRGVINMRDVSGVELDDKNSAMFHVVTPDRVYDMEAEDAVERTQWVEAWKAWLRHYENERLIAENISIEVQETLGDDPAKPTSTLQVKLPHDIQARVEKDAEVQKLRAQLLEKDKEIEQLQQALREAQLKGFTTTKNDSSNSNSNSSRSNNNDTAGGLPSAAEADMWDAVRVGDQTLAQQSIAEGAVPAEMSLRLTGPLHLAVESGNTGLVEMLVGSGCDVNRCNSMGKTPLGIAVQNYNGGRGQAMVETLLRCGARPEKVDLVAGFSPLHIAVMQGAEDLAQFLLRKVHVPIEVTDTTLQWTPLHWAASTGNASMCKFLLKQGANMSARSPKGQTPWDIAMQEGHTELAQKVLKPKK